MPLTNSARRFGTVTKCLHWLTALLIFSLIPLGIYANHLPYDTGAQLATKGWYFSLHKTLGVALLMVALSRIAWAISQPKPVSLNPDRRAETTLAATVYWLLYGSLVLVPMSGWVHHAATSGFAPIWGPLGQSLPFVPKSETLAAAAAGLHIVFERVLAASILLHIAGALKHHFIDRDATLRRMWFGRIEAGGSSRPRRHALPLLAALAVWCFALIFGAALDLYRPTGDTPQAAALVQARSDWEVQDGTLYITLHQFGTALTGHLDNWTAEITFDPRRDSGTVGTTRVTIATGSLKLGSVTAQALGPDYFDSATFPTARFAADLTRDATGYTATGTLTLKDTAVPVSLPFDLVMNGDSARATGTLTLDRRDFGIGRTVPSGATLGFAVTVSFELVAQRAP